MVDAPGHVDFAGEVDAALSLVDGAVVVVDCIEGVRAHTEAVLRQAVTQGVKPVLMINKLDRALLEMQLDPEDCYKQLSRIVEKTNVIINTFALPGWRVQPDLGSVGFGSGLYGWGFTLDRWAALYAAKFGVAKERLVKRLWGDNYYDPVAKKWRVDPKIENNKEEKEGQEGQQQTTLKRGFCEFVLEPLYTICSTILNHNTTQLNKILDSLQLQLTPEEKDLIGKPLLKAVMRKFFPAAPTLLQMAVVHLPSPTTAQPRRLSRFYPAPIDDETSQGLVLCDPKGPLLVYIAKMTRNADTPKGRFYGVGRVFSGRLRAGEKVFVLQPQHNPTKKAALAQTIPRVHLMRGTLESVEECPCGGIFAFEGVDRSILRYGTLTDTNEAHTFRVPRWPWVSPLFEVCIDVKSVKDLPRLVEGLKLLSKSDLGVRCYFDESGAHTVAGTGELHLALCVQELQEEFVKVELVVSKPYVRLCETVTMMSSHICLAKSPNKHNRLWFTAEPLHDHLATALTNGTIDLSMQPDATKVRTRILTDDYGWDSSDARKIWAFGPDDNHPYSNEGPCMHMQNILVDTTRGVYHINEIKDAVTHGFQLATMEGVLCGEPVRGVRFNVVDAVMVSDAVHRGAGNIIPTSRRAHRSSFLTAGPRLMEPFFLVEITLLPTCDIGTIYRMLNTKRAFVFNEEAIVLDTNNTEGNLVVISAYLPYLESFGFAEELRLVSSGQAFAQCAFDHWHNIPGDPVYELDSLAGKICAEVRKRKGMKEDIPPLSDFLDKL